MVLSSHAEENFAGTVPSMRDADLAQQERFWAGVERNYHVGFRNNFYIVLLRNKAVPASGQP